jgi:putative FmdB family regulatory protein
MPTYEFYCSDCHTVFSFLSRTPSTKRPGCPRCGRRRLERKVSAFAISRGRGEPAAAAAEDEGPLDDGRMERAMAEMAQEVEGLDEDDPRQMAGLMRKLFDRTGMPVGPGMEEAIRRMEAGEDPDRIEEELGDLLEGEMEGEPASPEPGAGALRGLRRRLVPPRVDTTLYEL